MLEKQYRPAVILLVEDDLGDQELTRRALSESKINNCLKIVGDGEEALDYLYQRNSYSNPADSPRPDIILLDLNLPKINGLEVLKTISADESLKKITVIVLTTSREERDIVESYNLGSSSYIIKPVSFDKFTETILKLEEYWLQIVVLPDRETDI